MQSNTLQKRGTSRIWPAINACGITATQLIAYNDALNALHRKARELDVDMFATDEQLKNQMVTDLAAIEKQIAHVRMLHAARSELSPLREQFEKAQSTLSYAPLTSAL